MRLSLFHGKEKTVTGPGLSLWLLSQGMILFHRYLCLTSRVRHHGIEKMQEFDLNKKGFILGAWHGNLLAATLGFRGQLTNVSTILASRSPYGAFLTPFIGYLGGYKLVRGSGTGKAANKPKNKKKGGREAFHEILDILERDENVIMTADVAPGPSYESGEGIVLLSSRSGKPIIPISVACKRYKLFPKAWDKFQLPLGFSRYVSVWGAPFYAKPDLTPKKLEAERQRLTDHMNSCLAQAYTEAKAQLPTEKRAKKSKKELA